jgi:hypothetical protein
MGQMLTMLQKAEAVRPTLAKNILKEDLYLILNLMNILAQKAELVLIINLLQIHH